MKLFDEELTLKRALLYALLVLVVLMILNIFMKLLPVAVILFILLAPPIFVLADAQERGIKRPLLWSLFTLFTSVFGLLVYLLARPDGKPRHFCAQCGGETDPSFHNCPWCGGSLVLRNRPCPGCGSDLRPEWKFCPACRRSVANEAVPAATPASGTSSTSSNESVST
jgi:hypothetical protein